VDRSPLVIGLAAVFGGMTLLLFALTVVFRDPVVLVLGLTFAAVTYFFWYHATGRIRRGVRRRARRRRGAREERADGEERGGFGAGPRFGEANTRFGREARQARQPGQGRRAGRTRAGPGADGRARAGGRGPQGQRLDPERPTRREAYRTLGLDPGADEEAVRRAYREKVKEVHPDRGGDEQEFRAVTDAYERLT
jgi:DnaJ-domain-containing protein 1